MENLEIKESDMEFVQNFTPPDFQVKNFAPSISPNFNSFSKKKHKKLVKMEKFTPLATNFTLPPGLTGWTNFTSGRREVLHDIEKLKFCGDTKKYLEENNLKHEVQI